MTTRQLLKDHPLVRFAAAYCEAVALGEGPPSPVFAAAWSGPPERLQAALLLGFDQVEGAGAGALPEPHARALVREQMGRPQFLDYLRAKLATL